MNFGIPLDQVLANPTLELHDVDGTLLASNDDWEGGAEAAEIANSGLAPTSAQEPAIIAHLNPGAYTAVVRGTNDTTGLGLIEIYNIDPASGATLVNVSSRGSVLTGNSVLIGGFIVSGDAQILLRAIGPSLISFGVNGALLDPTMEVYDSAGTLLASNDNWSSDQAAALAATGVAPRDLRESAVLMSLPKGAYTLVVRGVNGATGVALVEAYFMAAE